MKPIYIYTMSISLQIAGALILLLWSLGNTKKKGNKIILSRK